MRRLSAIVTLVALPIGAVAADPALDVKGTINRGLAFLTKDALAWKQKHNCASCHHASLVIWSMREAKLRGHAVNEPILAELTKWVAESGDGKTGVPRLKGVPKALNTKAMWFALALGAGPKPDAIVQKGLKLLGKTMQSDQTEKGAWASWPDTRPPIFGNSDESMTALATLALLPAAATGDDGSWPITSRPTAPGGKETPGQTAITGAGSAWAILGLARSSPAVTKPGSTASK